MEKMESNNALSLEQLTGKIQSIEERLSKIESMLASGHEPEYTPSQVEYEEEDEFAEGGNEGFLESNFGKYVLGWLGNIVFIFAIVYVMSFVRSKGFPVLSYGLGFIGVGGMLFFSHSIRRSFSFISYLSKICAYLLLFYIVASLHFISGAPVITSRIVGVLLLVLVAGAQLHFASRRNSGALAGIGILMLLVTAILSNTTHLMLPLVSLAAAAAAFLFIRFEWSRMFILTILLVYGTHILWLLNNPFMGNDLEPVSTHQFSLVYLFVYGAFFSLPMIFRHWEKTKNWIFSSVMLINALSFFGVLLITIHLFYPQDFVWIFSVITIVCLLYSVALKLKSEVRYGPAFYACFGFIALSAAIYGYFDLPNSYFLLALQSFLVVSMAIWYRSSVIIVVNTLLFLYLLVWYVMTTESMDSINFSFAFVGLATARILNWKKERLALRTEIFRNLYLIASSIMVLYALYHVVPSFYVTLSWTGAAVFYFLLSFLLNNVKYRWMSIGTLVVTAFYLFLVDLSSMALEYRVVAFLCLAVISLAASMYYAKRSTKKENEP